MIPFGEDPIPVSVWENRAADPHTVEDAFRGTRGASGRRRCLPKACRRMWMLIAFSKRCRRDVMMRYALGNAMVLDPYGRIIAETAAINDDMVAAELDLDLVSASVGQWWMRFRRPELYRPLARRTDDTSNRAAA